jgi:hypothetical protein
MTSVESQMRQTKREEREGKEERERERDLL